MKQFSLSFFLSSVFCLSLLCVRGQQGNSVIVGTIDSIQSKILHEQRKIWIHVPASARDTASKRRYPVVYLLDGESKFTGTAGMIDLLSPFDNNMVCPEMIVIGIPNTNRDRDLTPTHVAVGGWIDSSMSANSGGGEAFLSFIEKELIPHIDSLYPTAFYRMFVGHSFGGLLVIDALVHHKDLFKSYLAIEPSMWWDKTKLLQEAQQSLRTESYKGTALFLAMAHTQAPGMDTASVQLDSTDGTIHPRSILLLNRYIKESPANGLEADFRYYDDDTHSSVPLIATYDALHFLFKDHRLNLKDEYILDSTFKLAHFFATHFANLTSKYGIVSYKGLPLLPPEDLLNGYGYFVMRKNQFTKAEELFRLEEKDYPGSFRTYDALGDLYRAEGDKTRAIVNYKKSLSLNETADTRAKLTKLEGSVKADKKGKHPSS